MPDDRLSKDSYYLNIALEVSKRGTCLRRNHGAVIVNHDSIVSTGYSGAARGAKNCTAIGSCRREELEVPAGERYELCRSVHAEMNAIIHASREECMGGTLYVVGIDHQGGKMVPKLQPCALCKRVIINAGIVRVVSLDEDGDYSWDVADWIRAENP